MTEKECYADMISALLENRDFLGHQISYTNGILSYDEFKEITDTYFLKRRLSNSDEILLPKVKILIKLLGDKLDINVLSLMLRCDYEQAERLLKIDDFK